MTAPAALPRPAALRVAGGLALIAVVVGRIGVGPFVHGLHAVTAAALGAALAITAVTTLCSAWRWSLVARGLGVGLPLPTAIAAYYRSQFINLVLPGGIVGDVHRGVVHGRDVGSMGGGLRAVAWERAAGQVVQAGVALIVLVALPSPVRVAMPVVLLAVGGGALVAGVVTWLAARVGRPRVARLMRAAASDLRAGPLAPGLRLKIALASLIVVAGHTAVFVIAARVAGPPTSITTLLPLAVLVQLASSVPLGIAGWGPREGAAAWAFAAAGLGAGAGVAVTTLYGVLALAAVLPGAAVLAADGWRGAAAHRHARTDVGVSLRLAMTGPMEGGDGG